MDKFYALINNLISQPYPTFVLGDFNIDLFINPQFAADLDSTFDIKQHITKATRIAAASASLIDLIYTAGINSISYYVQELHIADYRAVSCNIQLRTTDNHDTSQLHRYSSFRSMKNLDISTVQDELTALILDLHTLFSHRCQQYA